jgi:hypothetical protein
MANKKFGTTDWNEETSNGKKERNNDNKLQYMKFVNGSNIVRIITNPKTYITHKYKQEEDSGYGDWVKCSKPLYDSCPLCDLNDAPKQRWLVGAIDRASGQFRILDIASTIYEQIKTLNKTKWGDPKKYDIEIVMNDKAPAANFYKVLPQMPEPLSEADLAIIKNFDDEELSKRCTPPKPDWVLSRINTVREQKKLTPLTTTPKVIKPKGGAPKNGKSASPVVQVNSAEDSSDENEDLDFPVAANE